MGGSSTAGMHSTGYTRSSLESVMSTLVIVVFLVLFMVVKGQDCTLDRYDLITAQKQRYWQLDVDGTDCYKFYQGGTCTVYFSVCGELPDDLCGSKGVAACQVAVSADRRSRSSFILGTTATRSFTALGEVGFREHFSNGGKADNCNTSIAMNIMFTCDATAIWLSGTIGASVHLVHFNISGCQASLELRYSGACYDPGSPQSCSYNGSYDITTLTSREMWYVPVQLPSLCYPSSSFGSCVLLFSFCQPLPRGACNNSTFCQATPYISLRVLSFGTYDPENQLQLSSGNEEFTITNTGGSTTGSCSGGLRSSVVFQCDSNARWEELPEGNITSYVRSIEHDTTNCMMTVTVGYNGACQSLPLSTIIAISVVGVIILLLSMIVGICIAVVTYRHINRKYGGYTRVGVHASEEQMERLLFRGQTSESEQSDDDESRSPPPPAATNDDEAVTRRIPQSRDDEQRIPTLEVYQPN